MKKIIIPYKKANFLFKYFWWVGFVYFIGTMLLTNHIFKIFALGDKLSFPLYECPGFFLCFIDRIPIISNAGIILKDPVFILVWAISWLIIFIPPLYIFMTVVEFEPYSKDMSKKKRSLAFFLKKKK